MCVHIGAVTSDGHQCYCVNIVLIEESDDTLLNTFRISTRWCNMSNVHQIWFLNNDDVFLGDGLSIIFSASLHLLKARSPSRLGGLGECCKLLQRVLGRRPRNRSEANRSDFEHFLPKLSPFWDFVNLRYFGNQIEKIAD